MLQPSTPDLVVVFPVWSQPPAPAVPDGHQSMDKTKTAIHIVEWFHSTDAHMMMSGATSSPGRQHERPTALLASLGWTQVTTHTVGVGHSGILNESFMALTTALQIAAPKAKTLAAETAGAAVVANANIMRACLHHKRGGNTAPPLQIIAEAATAASKRCRHGAAAAAAAVAETAGTALAEAAALI